MLLQSFETGDPQKVFEAAVALVTAYRDLQCDLAKVRFEINFGTDRCRNCDGLKAGPGVLATCYQVKQCNFTNVKEADQNPRHLRVLANLATTEQMEITDVVTSQR